MECTRAAAGQDSVMGTLSNIGACLVLDFKIHEGIQYKIYRTPTVVVRSTSMEPHPSADPSSAFLSWEGGGPALPC